MIRIHFMKFYAFSIRVDFNTCNPIFDMEIKKSIFQVDISFDIAESKTIKISN